MKKKSVGGLHEYRFPQNPEEERFARAWEKEGVLHYLLSTHGSNKPVDPNDRDAVVAATVIQWLGSPVGQDFLEKLGYVKEKR